MGQIANGILYGCKAPEFPGDEDGEELHNIVDRWEKANGFSWRDRGARVRVEGDEEGTTVIGVWVAVGGSGEDDAPYFVERCLPLDQVASAYAPRMAEAEALWNRFADHVAATESIQLPAATLWLTPCEVA